MGRLEKIIGVEIIDDDIRLGHTWYEVKKIKEIIDLTLPDNFVEIGVHEGGLSKVLIEAYFEKLHYVGIDIDCGFVHPQVMTLFNDEHNSELLCKNCFSNEVIDRVERLSGKKIVYCDGGNKSWELVVYSNVLKSGDLILSHDFSDGSRSGRGLPDDILIEVFPYDVLFLENDNSFSRLSEEMFKHTRIIGYIKK